MLDIGAGTTNLIVIEDGEVQHIAVLPIGGTHITNDLAIGLKTELDTAERVKLEFATLGAPKRATATIKATTPSEQDQVFDMDDIIMIVEARVEELFEYVDKELIKIKRSRKLPGGVVITGGTAKLPGMADFAKEHLELPARVGKLQTVTGLADSIDDTAFCTVVGLMLLDMLLLPDSGQDHGEQSTGSKAADFVGGLFGRLRK